MNKTTILFALLIFSLVISCQTTENKEVKTGNTLTKEQIIQDLDFIDQYWEKRSSYQGLNGFSYKKEFDEYAKSLDNSTSVVDFGLFLTQTLGKIGDRHSYIKGYSKDFPNSLFLPFIAAPLNGQVIALDAQDSTGIHSVFYPNYPYLKKINGMETFEFLKRITPEEVKAPREALLTRAVGQLKYMEVNYTIMQLELPDVFTFTFSNPETQKDTVVSMPLETKRSRYFKWKEKFHDGKENEELNDVEYARNQFHLDNDNIAYVRFPDMADPKEAPIFYEELTAFMKKASNSKALIVDVRSNDGGSRDLIFELAKYAIHPDAIHVVNVAQQRSDDALNKNEKGGLHHRSLFALDELDTREQKAVQEFLKSFKPMHTLDPKKFSEYHFALFNGQKLKANAYHYKKPIYILMNERSFSSASILCATFKGIPNVTLAGVTTDASSGHSRKFDIPNSKLRGKISTMVSFQKDGKLLDGYGTEPDIEIQRSLNHVLWKEDSQLKDLKKIINQ